MTQSRLAFAALATSVIIASCSRAPNNSAVRVGIFLSLTGDVAAYGQRSLRGAQLAIDEVNSGGQLGKAKIVPVIEDTKSNPRDGVAAFQKVIGYRVS